MAAKCPACGAPMENNSCGYCGYKEKNVQDSEAESSQAGEPFVQPNIIINNQTVGFPGVVPGVSRKSKTIALLLCVFLGWLGIHRFYVGKVGTGILYFLTCGLFVIGWLIDIIVIASGAFKDQFDLPIRYS